MNEIDFRGEKMDSSEGRGFARRRFLAWWAEFPVNFRRAFGACDGSSPLEENANEPPLEAWGEVADSVREESELVGFWVAWHRAGGFHGLELAGWNRATIYRKLKRFRVLFEDHPDEYEFGWIKLDLATRWMNDLGFVLDPTTNSWKDA